MCRNHSHVTASKVEIVNTGLGMAVRIQMTQDLTVQFGPGRSLRLKSPIVLYVPSWAVAGYSLSAPVATETLFVSMAQLLAESSSITEEAADK